MRKFRQVLCWLMAFAVPVSLSAAEVNPAILSGLGDVRINGSAAQQSSTVYAGDRIATGDKSSVTVALKGTVIAAPSHSCVIYRGVDVELRYGSVVVNTQSAIRGHIGSLTITPGAGGGKFELTETNLLTKVAALRGAVNVTDGDYSVNLPSGKTLTRDALLSNQSSSDSCDREPAAIETSQGQAPTGAHTRGIPGWVIGVGAAAAAGGILGALAGSSSTPTSPSKP